MAVSVRIVGRGYVNRSIDFVVFESARVDLVTNGRLDWEMRLPDDVDLPASHHRGVALRFVYFVEVELGHPDNEQAIRKFRVPLCVRASVATFSNARPSSPYTTQWSRIVERPDDSNGWDGGRGTLAVPEGASESDSMMEQRLAQLEARLRAEFDGRGMKQPEADWHWLNSSSHAIEEDDDDTEQARAMVPQSFRIDFLEKPIVKLLLVQDRFQLGDVVRGQFLFEQENAIPCLFVCIKLACREFDRSEDVVQRSNVVWAQHREACDGVPSLEFGLPLPVGPEACANYHSDTVYLQWVLEFQFVLPKDGVGDSPAGTTRWNLDQLTQAVDGDKSTDQFDLLRWELPLTVHPEPAERQPSSTAMSFFVHPHELPST
ncbi:Arrestin-like N-terminal domain-containing protein [Plasmodiophora brassicae]|uniref:Uncharacterized protein n=1 Tax=Plasmodiophora brassicae TaxID=37360 RepID=A0A0G4ILR2_PLABS|nr:hypothetical protein PBRA_004774 [Plasmodiophora brassicae]